MKKGSRTCISSFIVGFVVFFLLTGGSFIALKINFGKNLGWRDFARAMVYQVTGIIKTFVVRDQIRNQSTGEYKNIIFLHHSVGNGMINDGHLRELLKEKGYYLWDQGYWSEGLRDYEGKSMGFTYSIPGDNTDPDGLSALFSEKYYPFPINSFSQIMQHEVILIKSCFPNNNIQDQVQEDKLKTYYQNIRKVMLQHPQKLFIILTTPPLNPVETDAAAANRARKMSKWLQSGEFLQGAKNIKVFDLYDILSEQDQQKVDFNMLKSVYQQNNDSHPNKAGSEEVAFQLANFVQVSITEYIQSHSAR